MNSLGCHARHATLPHPERLAAAEVIQEASSFPTVSISALRGTDTVLAIDHCWTYWGLQTIVGVSGQEDFLGDPRAAPDNFGGVMINHMKTSRSHEECDDGPIRRVPFDVESYSRRSRTGPCFICAIVSRDPGQPEEIVYDDGTHIGFLARFAALPGYVLVAPKTHIEHVVRDLDEEQFIALMRVVRRVALALEASVPCERTYLLSLGSKQGNAHLHWHIAALPPGVPYEQQQYHALMAENGVVEHTPQQAATLAARIRGALNV